MHTLDRLLRERRGLGRALAIGFAATIGWFVAGCASTHFESKESKPISSYEVQQEFDGFRIALEPLTDAAESERMFKMNLLKRGILAVFVVATNFSTDTSFLLAPEQFTLASQAGQATPQRVDDPASFSTGMTAALLIGLVGATLIGNNPDQALANNQNFYHRELGRNTLSPGGTASGYCYFKVPKTESPSAEWSIRCKVRALGAGDRGEKELRFAVNWPKR